MKRQFTLLAGFLAVLMLGTVLPARAADPDILYVRHIEGAVTLSEANSPQAIEAAVNTPLIDGDTVATGPNGKAELFLKDGSVVRVGKNSVLQVTAAGEKGVQFTMRQGTTYIVSQGSRELPIFVNTPLATLDISSPSSVRIDAYTNGIDEISVLKGGIFASQPSGRMLVRQGERLVLKANGPMPVVAALRAPDDWLRWNIDRDAMSTANATSSDSYAYLPEELRTYSSDLDVNGQWIYTPEYEYVWVPTVIIAGGWSPYRHGRWAWIRGNYVWVGYEPWGWAPYHYGRWVHHQRAGWCWVPPRHRDVRWEPAHVAWVHSSRQIGWVPLAPGERYDRRNAPVIHQAKVRTTPANITIERSAAAARGAYRNASVANSMVAVERDRMLSRKLMPANTDRAAPMLKKVSLPPNATPARTTGRTVNRPSPERKTPPVSPALTPPSGVTAGASRPGAQAQNPLHTPPVPVSQPSVGTRQQPGTSLNSRIENARTLGPGTQTGPGPRKESQPAIKAAPQPVRTMPLRERAQLNSPRPAERAPSKPAAPEPSAPRRDVTGGTAVSPSPAPTAAMPSGGPRNAPRQALGTVSTQGLNRGGQAVEGNPTSTRAIPARPPVKDTAPAFTATRANPAPEARQVARPPERRPSPVVSVPRNQPSGSPAVSRQREMPTGPAKATVPQAANQPRAAVPVVDRVQAPAPAQNPQPRAAGPARPVPPNGQPAKNDKGRGPEKDNNRPHA